MYIPEYTKSKSDLQNEELIKANPFVTLISVTAEGEPFISHVPVVTEFKDHKLISVRGHFAIRNPHVKVLQDNPKVLVIFHGPHTYLTPTWYKSGRDVPSWLYTVVHVKGALQLDHSFESICTNLAQLTKEFEGQKKGAWKFSLPDDLKDPAHLTAAIVAFNIIPNEVSGKFKLAQSKPKIDQQGVIDGLADRKDDMSAEISKQMKSNLEVLG